MSDGFSTAGKQPTSLGFKSFVNEKMERFEFMEIEMRRAKGMEF